MNTYVVFFADQDQIALEADSFDYGSVYLTFSRRGDKVAVFYVEKLKGFALEEALVEEEEDAHGADEELDF